MLRKLFIISLLSLPIFLGSVSAQQESWKEGTYFKQSVAGAPQSIQKLLSDFGKAQKIPVVVEDGIEILVNVQYPPMSPVDYLDALTQDNGLVWFESAGVIYVSKAADIESRLLPLNQGDLERLMNVLKRFGVYSERFPIQSDPDLGVVYVVGPTRYVDEVEKIATDVDSAIRRQASVEIEVRIVHLKNAWADDRVFKIGQNQVAVPGIATILNSIVTGRSTLPGTVSRTLPYNRPGLNGQGMISPYNQILTDAGQAAVQSQILAERAEARYAAAENIQRELAGAKSAAEAQLAAQVSTVIQAYPRLNAIIIKDVKERVDELERIIKELDQPVGLVQIKATLIDIDANHAFKLGSPYNVMWSANGKQKALQLNLNTSDVADLAADPGNFTIRLASAGVDEFLANLQALEEDGHARMVAKPSVLTLDNTEAYLEEAEEFYVRVQGSYQVDLFNVLVGTQLYISPHIIHNVQGRSINLNIRIQDGSRSETSSVDEIPVVSRNTINTQAVLLEGQSLLIGGLMREEENKTVRGFPVLSRIPRVGALFRETQHETQRVERLVMLTPTLIDLPYSPADYRPSEPTPPSPPVLLPPEPFPQQQSRPPYSGKLPPIESVRQTSYEKLEPMNQRHGEGRVTLSAPPTSRTNPGPVTLRRRDGHVARLLPQASRRMPEPATPQSYGGHVIRSAPQTPRATLARPVTGRSGEGRTLSAQQAPRAKLGSVTPRSSEGRVTLSAQQVPRATLGSVTGRSGEGRVTLSAPPVPRATLGSVSPRSAEGRVTLSNYRQTEIESPAFRQTKPTYDHAAKGQNQSRLEPEQDEWIAYPKHRNR